jgi:phosphoserine aminotransferase
MQGGGNGQFATVPMNLLTAHKKVHPHDTLDRMTDAIFSRNMSSLVRGARQPCKRQRNSALPMRRAQRRIPNLEASHRPLNGS